MKLYEQGIKTYELPDCESDEDEDYVEQTKQLKAGMPFAVVGSNTLIELKNPKHCDFVKLRTMLITHMQDLKEVTQETHYENFRATQLSGESPINPISNEDLIDAPKNGKRAHHVTNAILEKDRALMQKEEELRRMQEMIAKMQEQMKSQS
ncbi:septin 2 [Desmophyllum pertusum]|uniref:Septin 2 n=1 Tax=Desmophyllum pertusum TaxID=174260 RepID=A0A9W9ZUQ0_9CNID|nr:septin 2 [Desmophyllum pertusum]